MKYSRVILVIAWVGLLFTSVTTVADPITNANVYTLLDNEGASPVGTGQGENFSIGVSGVSPSAAEGTTGRAINLDTLDELTLGDGVAQGRPGLIGIDISLDQAIANGWLTPWEIILTNGIDTRSYFTFDRTGVSIMEFVENLAISGPATVPIVTWQLPTTGPAVDALFYEVWDVDGGVILTPGQISLPAGTETLTLNNVTLEIGGNYAVRIIPANRDGGNITLTRSSNWIGWTATSGQAEGEVLELVTGSPVGVSQVVDTPASTFVVEFDYSFATATGDLEVFIDGNKIGTTLTAPTTVANEFYHAVFEVEDTSLLGLTSATFLIQLDGPTGSTVLVDNIVLAGLANGDFSSGVAEWTPTGSGSVATVPAPCSEFPGRGNTGGCFPGPGPFPGKAPERPSL